MESNMTGDEDRVRALCALHILDTPQEERFDRLTRLARAAFSAPIALVSLIDDDRQWFKSRAGLAVTQTPRSISFCTHAVAASTMLVVPDADLDPRFAHNPLVLGPPHIRFYAGQPIYSADGHPLGTLCVIDRAPRQFSDADRRQLRDLAALVEMEINHGAMIAARLQAEQDLRDMNAGLEQRIAERTASLEIKNRTLEQEMRRRESVEANLRASEARMRTTIATSFNAFVGIDDRGLIIDWNAAAEQTFGWTRDEIIGRDFNDTIIAPCARAGDPAGLVQFVRTGVDPFVNQRIELPAVRSNGEELSIEMTINAFMAGEAMYLGAFMHDISDRLEAHRAIEQKQELLDAILDTVDMGVIACSAKAELTMFNRAARKLHGLPPEAINPDDWASHYDLFAADGVTLMERADIPLFRAFNGERVKDVEMVVAPAGKRRRIMLASGRPLKSAGGEPLGAVVAMKDITDLSESQRQLTLSEERLRTITDNMPVLIAYIGRDLRYQFANALYEQWFGVPRERIIGRTVEEAFGRDFYARRRKHLNKCFDGHKVQVEIDVGDGAALRVILSEFIPHVRDGVVLGAYVLSTDVTATREYETRLKALANTDPLTGLFNRRGHEIALAAAIQRARRTHGALALMYLDIDHFKQVNDTLGHAAGDAMLNAFAMRLSATVRASDIVCRLAGDEFTVILEGVRSAAECGAIGATIVAAMQSPFAVGPELLLVTTSIGVAWVQGEDAVAASMAEAADTALYAAKAAGRNQFRLAGAD